MEYESVEETPAEEVVVVPVKVLTPRNYDVKMQDGTLVEVKQGFLGINNSYVAIADDEDRLIFASALLYVNHVKVSPDKVSIETTTKGPSIFRLITNSTPSDSKKDNSDE